MGSMVCDTCKEGYPERMSCIHTFKPRVPKGAWQRIQESDLEEEKKEAVRLAYYKSDEN